MPRAISIVAVSLLAWVLAAPGTLAAPFVPDVLNGSGQVTTFEVFGEGLTLEGAPYEWNDVCARCLMRITIADGVFVVIDLDGGPRQLDPGVYELREYRGLFLLTQAAPHDFTVEMHGAGKLIKLG